MHNTSFCKSPLAQNYPVPGGLLAQPSTILCTLPALTSPSLELQAGTQLWKFSLGSPQYLRSQAAWHLMHTLAAPSLLGVQLRTQPATRCGMTHNDHVPGAVRLSQAATAEACTQVPASQLQRGPKGAQAYQRLGSQGGYVCCSPGQQQVLQREVDMVKGCEHCGASGLGALKSGVVQAGGKAEHGRVGLAALALLLGALGCRLLPASR